MALPLFSEGFFQQIILHAHLGIHPLQATVLVRHGPHLRHHRRIHPAILRTPFIKAGAAHAMLATKFTDQNTASASLKIPMICASLNRAVFIKNLLRYLAEKILLVNTTNFRGEYHSSFEKPHKWGDYPGKLVSMHIVTNGCNHLSDRSAFVLSV